MKTGISTGCLYPELTENSFDILLRNGFNTFEIFFNSFSELEPDFLNKIVLSCIKNNARVISIHPFTSVFESYLLFSGYERRFLDGIKMYQMYFRTAQRLSADYVVLHGMLSDFSSITDREYCRRFEILSDEAESYGVKLLQENVFRHISGNSELIITMKELLGDKANFVLDTKQARRCGYDPNEMALIMGSSLRHIHISDCTQDDLCTLPGTGDFDFSRFYDTLKSIDYNGSCIIEVYGKKGNNINDLVRSKKYLDNIISKCNTNI